MSEALNEVIGRAVNDEAFRNLLLTNPHKALQGYQLTDEERNMLQELTQDTFDEFAVALATVVQKGG